MPATRTVKRRSSKQYKCDGRGEGDEQGNQRYNLKADYPMVAENYASVRRDFAKKSGLGRKGRDGAAAEAPAAPKAARLPRAKND